MRSFPFRQGPVPIIRNPSALPAPCTRHWVITRFTCIAHLEGELGMPSIVTAQSFQFLHAPVGVHSYALGWDNDNSQPWSNGPVLVHNGSNLRWLASAGLVPGLNAGVLIVSNAANTDTEIASGRTGSTNCGARTRESVTRPGLERFYPFTLTNHVPATLLKGFTTTRRGSK